MKELLGMCRQTNETTNQKDPTKIPNKNIVGDFLISINTFQNQYSYQKITECLLCHSRENRHPGSA